MRWLPDPVTEADLRLWANDLADAGADIFVQEAYTQGWTTYWRTDRYAYDARPQHERFLPLLDASLQPLQILLEESHEGGRDRRCGEIGKRWNLERWADDDAEQKKFRSSCHSD